MSSINECSDCTELCDKLKNGFCCICSNNIPYCSKCQIVFAKLKESKEYKMLIKSFGLNEWYTNESKIVLDLILKTLYHESYNELIYNIEENNCHLVHIYESNDKIQRKLILNYMKSFFILVQSDFLNEFFDKCKGKLQFQITKGYFNDLFFGFTTFDIVMKENYQWDIQNNETI